MSIIRAPKGHLVFSYLITFVCSKSGNLEIWKSGQRTEDKEFFFVEKDIHQVCYHLVHSVCSISMIIIKARQGIHRKFLKLFFVITSKQMVDII